MERLLNLNITETDTFGGEINWLVVHRLSIKHSGKDTPYMKKAPGDGGFYYYASVTKVGVSAPEFSVDSICVPIQPNHASLTIKF